MVCIRNIFNIFMDTKCGRHFPFFGSALLLLVVVLLLLPFFSIASACLSISLCVLSERMVVFCLSDGSYVVVVYTQITRSLYVPSMLLLLLMIATVFFSSSSFCSCSIRKYIQNYIFQKTFFRIFFSGFSSSIRFFTECAVYTTEKKATSCIEISIGCCCWFYVYIKNATHSFYFLNCLECGAEYEFSWLKID